MGNRALIRAFCKSGNAKGDHRQNLFEVDGKGTLKNVIFLAPDAKKTEFEKMDLRKKKSTCLFTIYSSATDLNLLLSKTFHEETQLVNTPNCVEKYAHHMPIDVIDITAANTNMSLHHSYLYLHRDITALEDIIYLIRLLSPYAPPRDFHLEQKDSQKPRLFVFTKYHTKYHK
jgi:esterase/lipase superfamily enzyme